MGTLKRDDLYKYERDKLETINKFITDDNSKVRVTDVTSKDSYLLKMLSSILKEIKVTNFILKEAFQVELINDETECDT